MGFKTVNHVSGTKIPDWDSKKGFGQGYIWGFLYFNSLFRIHNNLLNQ